MCLKTKLILFFCVFLAACHQDFESTSKPVVQIEDPQIVITTEVTGQVLDNNGNVEQDYTLDIGTNEIDQSNPYFLETIESVNKRGQYLEVLKDGTLEAFALLLLLENDVNVLNLHLFPELQQAETSINSSFRVNPNSSITFRSVQDVSGNSHSGNFQVFFRDISDAKYNWQTGNFGLDRANATLAFKSLDRFYMSLEKDDGIPLEIESTQAAVLSYERETTKTIGLFHFDPIDTKWRLIDDVINSKVELPSSGYYTIAEYEDGVYAEGHLLLDGAPLSYQKYNWENTENDVNGFTSLSGKFLSAIPASTDYSYTLLDPCDSAIESIAFSSSDEDQENILFAVENTGDQYYNLNTTVLSCDEQFNQEPAVSMIMNNGNYIYAFNDADINSWLSVCNNTFDIAAYNLNDNTNGPLLSWSTETETPIEYLSDCPDHLEGFSYLKIRQDERLYLDVEFTHDGNETILESTGGELKLIIR